jgi:hypothetical protein
LPFRIIPARGQVSQNSLHSPVKQRCDVFHDDDRGSNSANGCFIGKFSDDSGIFAPQTAAFTFDSGAFSGIANILAGKPAAKNIHAWQVVYATLPNIHKPLGVWKMLRKHCPAIRIQLHLPNRFNAGAFKAKIKPANPSE